MAEFTRSELRYKIKSAIKDGSLVELAEKVQLDRKLFLEKDTIGQPLIHLAAEQGKLDQVAKVYKKLGEKFGKEEITSTYDDSMGYDPYDDYGWAHSNGEHSVVELAAKKDQLGIIADNLDVKNPPSKADLFKKGNDGDCAIGVAAAKGTIKHAVKILDKIGEPLEKADFSKKGNNKRDLLQLSILGRCLDVAEKTINKKGEGFTKKDFSQKDEEGQNSIHAAAWWGNFKQVEDILDKNNENLTRDDFNVTDHKGDNVFRLVMWGGHIKEVDRILKKTGQLLEKKDLKGKGEHNRTGFHLAAEHGRIVETAEILRENGERVQIEDVLEGADKLSKERKAKAFYDKNGTRLKQFCDADLFSIKSFNKFWRETPDGFKTGQSEKAFRGGLSKVRESETKDIFSYVVTGKGR